MVLFVRIYVEILWYCEFIGKVLINIGLLKFILVSCIFFEFVLNIFFIVLYIISLFVLVRISVDLEFFFKEDLIDI